MIPLLLSLSGARAGDLLFVLEDSGAVASYDAAGNSRGSVRLSNGLDAVELAPSVGGRWIYAADRDGYLHTINPIGLVTAQGSWPFGLATGTLAASADRFSLYYGARSLYKFNTSSLSLVSTVVSGFDILEIAAHPSQSQVLAARVSNLWEYTPTPFSAKLLSTAKSSLADVTYTGDGLFAVATNVNGATSEIRSCSTSGFCFTATLPSGSPTALTPDAVDQVYAATDTGVSLYEIRSTGPVLVRTVSTSDARDVAVGEAGDVYVLYDDRIDHYAADLATSFGTVVSFADPTAWRWELLVTPDRLPNGLCKDLKDLCVREKLVALFDEVSARKLPTFTTTKLTCPTCSVGDVAFARTQAKSYLDRIGTKSLTPAQARDFLAETLEVSSREADWALDDELVVYK